MLKFFQLLISNTIGLIIGYRLYVVQADFYDAGENIAVKSKDGVSVKRIALIKRFYTKQVEELTQWRTCNASKTYCMSANEFLRKVGIDYFDVLDCMVVFTINPTWRWGS